MDMLAQIATNVLGFFLLVVILRKMFWGTILKLLDQRRAHIEEELRQVAQSKAELSRLQTDYRQRLAQIEDEARTKIQESILDGKRIAVEIQEQARQHGYALINKSKETIELELAKAKVTLRDQVAEMTMEALERILRHKLDAKTDRRLVETVLDELEQQSARD